MLLVQAVSVREFHTYMCARMLLRTCTHTGGCMHVRTPLEVFVQLHAPTDLPPETPPIYFHMRLFVPTASEDVVAMM